MKLICGRTTFIPGCCVFSLHRNDFSVPPYRRPDSYPALPDRCAEWFTYDGGTDSIVDSIWGAIVTGCGVVGVTIFRWPHRNNTVRRHSRLAHQSTIAYGITMPNNVSYAAQVQGRKSIVS
ncbi:hypothetical protein [Dactylosporangium sp. CA-139066]|uniref:hypothetical protein n=1 Tax=Dactylosporangium sp. CA-139066 TaxID=3239930 RepID=UPI003D8FBB7C